MGYYHAEPGMNIKDIAARWRAGDKIYDMSMPLEMPIEEVWKYRDYDRHRDFSRSGRPWPFYSPEGQDNHQQKKNYSGPEKWDLMIQSMQKYGWDKNEPLQLVVGKDGRAKIGEGNHRLAIARQLGMKTVPVFVYFNDTVYHTDPMAYEPRMVEMNFREFLEMSSLRDIIDPVPQSPKHHAEGSVGNHTRMVRKQLYDAIHHFQDLVESDPKFSNFSTFFNASDMNLLRLAAWMHDIGKASATTVNDQPWRPGMAVGSNDTIKAISHENPWHFEPMMRQLGPTWKKMYDNSSQEDKDDLWFMIQNHMKLKDFGFTKRILPELLDTEGKFKNQRKIKLLLILIMMDQTGRMKMGGIQDQLPTISSRMSSSAQAYQAAKRPVQPRTTWDDPVSLAKHMLSKGVGIDRIKQALTGKFGREFTDQEIESMLQ
jgi:hypothetical protein